MILRQKLTQKELIEAAETLHSFDWYAEGKNLVPYYKAMLNKFPDEANLSKKKQILHLIQLYYTNQLGKTLDKE
jgi:hypothetical protein